MKFLLALIIISQICSLKNKDNEDIIMKFSDRYYKKIGPEHVEEFKNMMFRELDKSEIIQKHNMEIINKTENPTINLANGLKKKRSSDDVRIYSGEYVSLDRVVKFYISHECTVNINDTVHYNIVNPVNFVEHMILHNNADSIDAKGVFSEDIAINFFAFNKKLNIFSVYFDPPKKTNFTLEYDYDAVNLIRSNIESTHDGFDISNNHTSSNIFVWKFVNQNFIKMKENITVEIYFDIGKEFTHEDVEFSLNFTKSIVERNKRMVVKYVWNGQLSPQEVIVLQAKFPLYFENCGTLSVNWIMIGIGSVFIVFLIGMLYMIISSVFLEDL
jgi:hypothetical protein